jgi:hypothetical protein
MTQKPKIILTGDRPTGRLHIGHYVGSLRRRVELQNDPSFDKIFIMIADAQALTDNADKSDVIAVASEIEKATGELRDLYRMYIKTVAEKNVGLFAELIEEDERMSDVLMDIMKDKVDKVVRTATAKNTLATTKDNVVGLMQTTGMDVRQAMDAMRVPEDIRDEVEALVGGDGD